jgi:hypothetical protein
MNSNGLPGARNTYSKSSFVDSAFISNILPTSLWVFLIIGVIVNIVALFSVKKETTVTPNKYNGETIKICIYRNYNIFHITYIIYSMILFIIAFYECNSYKVNGRCVFFFGIPVAIIISEIWQWVNKI